MTVPNVVAHLEGHLGEIEAGWSQDGEGVAPPFKVVRFGSGPVPGRVVFSTLGLSDAALPSRNSDRLIRHEFVMIVQDRLRNGPVPGLLQQIAREVLASGFALSRGDVIGPRGPVFAMSQMEAFYAAIPVFLPDAFGSCGDVVMVWLVPISRNEANFVHDKGWSAFEDMLVDADPDLTDEDRVSEL